MKLYELRNNIDDQLNNTAAAIGKTRPGQMNGIGPQMGGSDALGGPQGAPGGMQPDPMGNPMGGEQMDPNQPDLPMGAGPTDADMDAERIAKIDASTIAAVSGMPYVTDYVHRDEKSPTHPLQIASASMEDLMSIRNVARAEMLNRSISNQFGLFDRPDTKFYQDLLSYVERVIDMKKQETKNNPGSNKEHKPARVQKQPEPKTKAGEFKHRMKD